MGNLFVQGGFINTLVLQEFLVIVRLLSEITVTERTKAPNLHGTSLGPTY